MKSFVIFLCGLFFLVSVRAITMRHHVPADSDEHGPDLPRVGSSVFDKVFSDADGHYRVPYPLEKLTRQFAAMEARSVHSLLPFSRSLQRPQDLGYDPLLNPRLVLAPSGDRSALTRSKIFLGFVKAKDQLEVVSYNDEAGRFEYQIVTDYSGSPKVFYVHRGKCLTCHQGQAAIFSAPAWQDTSFGNMGAAIFTKLGLEGSPSQNRKNAMLQLFGDLASVDQAATFDIHVRESNDIALQDRIWVHGCGEDRRCRLGLLMRTLSEQSRKTNSHFKHAQSIVESSTMQGQTIYSSFLSSHDIGLAQVTRRYGTLSDVVHNPRALLDIISHLYQLPEEHNPATRRPFPLNNLRMLTGFLRSFTQKDLLRIRAVEPQSDRVAELLIRLYESGHALFDRKALNKLSVMTTVLSELGSIDASLYRQWLEKRTPEKKVFAGRTIPVFKNKELNIFSRYCHHCHASGLGFPPQFLLGSEVEVLGKIRALKSRLIFKLERGLMPPNPEQSEILRSSGDLDRLLDFLSGM